jgi:transcriptional regulator with GAF, ATPase, and Fis domain
MASNRSDRVLVPVNCSAIPENLIEAELFGHTKGAFTGAGVQRIGRFEQAQGSTLFLDEISDLPIDLQPKLLRALQEREIQRLGSSETLKVDVRVIAATNANLAERVRTNQFREDLFYRLNVVPIKMPPLRDRLSDIPLLVYHFVDKICRAEDIAPKQVPRETIDRLSSHSWPGNIRELENAVEMAVVLSGDRKQLHPSDFPLSSTADERISKEIQPPMPALDGEVDFERAVTDFERSILDQALRKAGGNKSIAANMLRLPRTTLISKLRALAALGE